MSEVESKEVLEALVRACEDKLNEYSGYTRISREDYKEIDKIQDFLDTLNLVKGW